MSIAFRLLKRLTKKELTFFKGYLVASTKKNGPQLLLVVELWENKKSLMIDEKAIFCQVFLDKKYSSQHWYTLMTQLQSQLESFLSMLELQEDKTLQKVLLLKSFRKRKMPHFFNRTYTQYQKIMAQLPNKTLGQMGLAYEGQEIYYDYVASQNRKKTTNLSIISQQLDVFFITEKLKQICRAYSRKLINQEYYDISFSSEVIDTLTRQPSLLKNPTIQLYYASWKAVVQEGSIDDFLDFKQLLENAGDGVSKQDMRDLFTMAANYCIRKSNTGDKNFEPITLNIYRQNLERGYLLEDGILPANTLMNIVSLGLKQQQFEWVTTFLDEYISFAPKLMQHTLLALSKARMYYIQEKWDDARLQLLMIGIVNERFLYLGVKSLEIKIHFEQSALNDAQRELDNLSKYLNRSKPKNDNLSIYYTRLIFFLRWLLRTAPNDADKRKELINAIKSDQIIKREHAWLLKIIK